MGRLPRPGLVGRWPGGGLAVDADACELDGEAVRWADVVARADAGEVLRRVDGAFALAWVDADGALHLARDAVGHRSLYWAREADGAVVYATRLHDVVARREARPRIHAPAVATYLAYAYVPGEETLVDGVRAVAAGMELVFPAGGGAAEERPFWVLPGEPPEGAGEDALRDELRALLERTVRRLLPEGAVAASLSGGIDSSLVVALARRLGERAVRTYSVSFGVGHANELEWSALVARHCGAEHVIVEVSAGAVLDRFDATVGALSEPNGDPLTVPNTLLFEAAGEHAAVLLNGEGGDPCFGGPKNAPMLLAELYGGVSREASYLVAHQRCYEDLPELLVEGFPADHLERDLARWFADPRWPGFLSRLMAINVVFKGAWHILPKVERLGAAAGVLARSPLFDRAVVELSARVPGRLKRSGPVEKHLLKAAVEDLLPRAILDRPKSGMMVPVEAWFSGPLRGWAAERLLEGRLAGRIARRPWLEALVDAKSGGLRPRRGIKIWQLLTLEAWIRSVEDAWRPTTGA